MTTHDDPITYIELRCTGPECDVMRATAADDIDLERWLAGAAVSLTGLCPQCNAMAHLVH